LALVAKMHAGQLSAADRAVAIRQGSAAAQADIRGLFDTFLPESQRRPTLGGNIQPQTILAKTGDLNRGKLIYFSDGARCRHCHDAGDRKQSLGPTIQDINKKFPLAAEMLQHVLQPSLKIEETFAAHLATTTDGRLIGGLLIEQNDREIALKTTEKKVVRLPRSEVEELRKSDKSLMPDNLFSDVTAQEAADLLAYLRSLGAAQ